MACTKWLAVCCMLLMCGAAAAAPGISTEGKSGQQMRRQLKAATAVTGINNAVVGVLDDAARAAAAAAKALAGSADDVAKTAPKAAGAIGKAAVGSADDVAKITPEAIEASSAVSKVAQVPADDAAKAASQINTSTFNERLRARLVVMRFNAARTCLECQKACEADKGKAQLPESCLFSWSPNQALQNCAQFCVFSK